MSQRKIRIQRLSNRYLLKEFMEDVGATCYLIKSDNAREVLEQDHNISELFDEILARMALPKDTR